MPMIVPSERDEILDIEHSRETITGQGTKVINRRPDTTNPDAEHNPRAEEEATKTAEQSQPMDHTNR